MDDDAGPRRPTTLDQLDGPGGILLPPGRGLSRWRSRPRRHAGVCVQKTSNGFRIQVRLLRNGSTK